MNNSNSNSDLVNGTIEDTIKQLSVTDDLSVAFTEALSDVEVILNVEDGTIVPFSELIRLPFEQAKRQTEMMSIAQRLEYIAKVDERRVDLYEQMKMFTAGEGIPKDMQISHKEFVRLLGKVKHCEIIQNWLYGVYL